MAELHGRVSRLPHLRLKASHRLATTLALLVLVSASFAWSDAGDAGGGPTRARALPELPRVPKPELPAPTEEQLAELDRRLSRFHAEEQSQRDVARRELLETPQGLVGAIDRRMNELAEGRSGDAMRRHLTAVRDKARAAERERMKAEGRRGAVATPDYLDMLVEFASPSDPIWRDLVSVVAMSRMLTHIGTVEAVRELIDVHVRFGELLRVDTQLQLGKLGDRAVAALVETRRHRAEKIARWAERQLDAMGRAIVSEAVQTDDQEVLADVLRAYGRIRDPDAARIVISFANSERAQIREAARQGVAMLGEVGAWQLRDSYENTVGKRPPRDWTWERTARELFAELDRLRLAQVYEAFEDGLQATREGKHEAARLAFDKVLAQSPLFERRAEMAAAYHAYALSAADTQPEQALDALRRAHRVSGSEEEQKRIESLRLTLESSQLLTTGVADRVMVERAIELDPSNDRARELAGRMERGEIVSESRVNRYLAAGAIGALALLAIGLISWRRPRAREPEATSEPEVSEPEATGEPTTSEPGAASEPEATSEPNSDGPVVS